MSTIQQESPAPPTEIATLAARYEVEKELVGIAITFPETLAKISAGLEPRDYVDDACRKIFTVIQELYEAGLPVSGRILINELQARKLRGKSTETWLERVGGTKFVGEACNDANVASTEYLIHALRRYSRRSTITNAAMAMLKACDDMGITEEEIVADFEKSVALVSSPVSTVRTLGEAAQIALDLQRETLLTGEKPGMPTGFRNLDAATGGFRRGQLVLCSGRSYVGKTTFALNMALRLACDGHKTVFQCMEMKDFELAERILCSEADLRLSQFAQSRFEHSQLDNAQEVVNGLHELPLWLPDATEETVRTIAAKAKYHKTRFGLDVLFVDHLQRLKRLPQHRNDQSPRFHLNESVAELKNLARSLDCVVVLLTQLKIPDAGKEDTEPTEADYSESRQIMAEADIGMLLHRQKDDAHGKLILNKVRRNGTDFIRLDFDGPHQRFTESDAQHEGEFWS